MAQKRTRRRVKADTETASTGILILGMHRSGTSALARVLNLLGAALGERLMPAGKGNESGHWESLAVYEAHEKLLTALGRRWDDFREMPVDWIAHPQAQPCAKSIRRFVADELAGQPLWAVKEPRLCRLLPLWPQAIKGLPLRLTAVIMVRNPLEVAASLARRDGIDPSAAIVLWMQHLIEAERASRDLPRVLVRYDELLTDWRSTTDAIATRLQFSWPVATASVEKQIGQFLSPQLRHHRVAPDASGDDALPALARRLYETCLRAPDDADVWGDIAAIAGEVEQAAALFGPCLDDVLARNQVAEQRAIAAETVVARGFADPERLDRQTQFIAEARDGSLQVVAKLEQTDPLLVELAAQVQAQRESVSQARDASYSVLSKQEQTGPLLAELIAQVQAQRESVAQARDASFNVLAKQEQSTPLLAELAAQVRAQREQIVAVAESLLSQLDAERRESVALHRQLQDARQTVTILEAEAVTNKKDVVLRGQEIDALSARGDELTRVLIEREQQLSHARHVIAQREGHIDAMQATLSWRLTAPLRFLRRMPASIVKASSAGLRTTYRSLPISWPLRLRIKAAVFRALAPMLRRTHAWQRWHAQREGRWFTPDHAAVQAPVVLSSEPVVEPVAGTDHDAFPTPVYVPLSKQPVASDALRARLIAFYLPQFHPIPENDAWWGRGFTEWTNVSKARPQFHGHEQPRLPGELGFYDLRLPEVMRRQIELARHYGIGGFCFHYYWFAGRRLLEKPMNQLLADPSLDIPFCVCWANENWTRRWDGQDNDVLIGQEHSSENDLHFIQDLEPVLRDPRYIRVDGRPLLVVYRPSLLPDAKATAARWRQYCREHGIGELLLVMAQFDAEDPRPFGFDAAVEFPPHKLAQDLPNINHTLAGLVPGYQGYVVDYRDIVECAENWPEPSYDMIRGVFPSWDNEARKPGSGYTFAHSSPALYQRWLACAIEYARRRPVCGEPVVFVNAWNEWAEGAYLEPDQRYGYAYLQATRDALTSPEPDSAPYSVQAMARDESSPRMSGLGNADAASAVAVVSHDAHPHGAQYLALNLARELRAVGVRVEIVLLGDGALLPDYQAVAPTVQTDGADAEQMTRVAQQLSASGVTVAIANTSVCGLFVRHLHEAGIEVVSLVHELPGVIEQYRLSAHVQAIAQCATRVVFAGDPVRAGFERYAPLRPGQTLIRPQGLYKRNAYRNAADRATARQQLRETLAIAADAKVIVCVGYADKRKGVDWFVDIGAKVCGEREDTHFVWIGHPDLAIQEDIAARVRRTGHADRFHFIGRREDTDLFYAGADIYALTSREDPYPSVVLEAFDVAVPVVGFGGVGGLDDLIRGQGAGLVPMGDTSAFADACLALLADDAARQQIGDSGRALIEERYAFRRYVLDLLAQTRLALPRVSVVVPNYNYAHYLPQRIESILTQRFAVYEVIVLDDASSDDSVQVLAQLQSRVAVPLRVVTCAKNSGSVFRQWHKGVELARGDFVWIAEADDLAEPGFLAGVMPAFARERVVMSYCQSGQIDADGTRLADDYRYYTDVFCADRWREPFIATQQQELAQGLAVKNTILNVSAVVFRRDALLRVLARHLDEICSYRIAGDWLTYVSVLEHGELAFTPQTLNWHRRHAGSVTLGGDNLPHLREVLRVQQHIRQRYRIGVQTTAQARAYAEHLYRHFGLASGGRMALAECSELKDVLA